MSKKGTISHVDWAISIGLFVLYVLLLFIFLRPGAEPAYSQSTLLKIVESSLDADAKYPISKTPLFIRPKVGNFPNDEKDYQAFIEDVNLPFVGEDENPKHFSLITTNYTTLPFKIKLKENPSKDELWFNSTFYGANKNYTFFLLNCSEQVYNSVLDKDENPIVYSTRIPASTVNFTYEFGVNELIRGFSSEKLDNLANYTSLKQRWNFPASRDFSIIVTDVNTNTTIKSVNQDNIPNNLNVFANYYLDWILDSDTQLKPIRVEIKIW